MTASTQNTAAVSSLSAAASPTGSSSPVRSGTNTRNLTGAEVASIQSARLRREMRCQRAARALPELAPADDTPRHAGLQQGEVIDRWQKGRSPRFPAGWWFYPLLLVGALLWWGVAAAISALLGPVW